MNPCTKICQPTIIKLFFDDILGNLAPTSVLAAVGSILHSTIIQRFLFFVNFVKLMIFLLSPLMIEQMNDTINYQFKMIVDTFSDDESIAMFIVSIVILRQFNGMNYVYTMILAWYCNEEVHSKYNPCIISNLSNIISPFFVALYGVLAYFECNFTISRYDNIMIVKDQYDANYIICGMYLSVICFFLYIMSGLYSASTDVSNDCGFVEPLRDGIMVEGLLMLVIKILFFIMIGFYFKSKDCQDENKLFIWSLLVRQILIFVLNFQVFVMIRWLRNIRRVKDFSYFHQEHKLRYLLCFKLICILSIYNIMIEIIFQIKIFYNIDFESSNKNILHSLSFSLAFSSIHFCLWSIDQMGNWIFKGDANLNTHPQSAKHSIASVPNCNKDPEQNLQLKNHTRNQHDLSVREKINFCKKRLDVNHY